MLNLQAVNPGWAGLCALTFNDAMKERGLAPRGLTE